MRRSYLPASLFAMGLMISTDAQAADLGYQTPQPVAASYDWTGVHVGLSGGYAFNGPDAAYSFYDIGPQDVVELPQRAAISNGSGIGGVSVGYDVQLRGVVIGFEGDFSWTGNGGSSSQSVSENVATERPAVTFNTSYSVDWISTLRGRIGLPMGSYLLYATGGLAFADVSLVTSVIVGDPPMGTLDGSASDTAVGWTLGGGSEVVLTDHITLKAEALYVDLGTVSANASRTRDGGGGGGGGGGDDGAGVVATSQKIETVIARAGIAYKF